MASKCPNCSNPLRFDPDYGALLCDKCGGIFDPKEIETEQRDLLEEQEIADLSEIYGGLDEGETCDFQVYTCNSCGGEIFINSTEASTFCIFCGSPSIVFSRVSKHRKPDTIIPFKITREEAGSLIRAQIKQVKSIPSQIRNFEISDIRGIYVPYLIYDVEYRDALFVEAEVGSKNARRSAYYKRAGRCVFSDVPVEASDKFYDGSSIFLEPYDLSQMVPFDEDYLTGFYSDICDSDKAALDRQVRNRLSELFSEQVKKTCRGRARVIKFRSPSIKHRKPPVYAMLPVWFLTFFYDGTPHTVLVNGQTGKVVAGLPWDKKKLVRDTVLFGSLCALPSFLITGLVAYAGIRGFSAGRLVQLLIEAGALAVIMLICGLTKLKELQSAIDKTQSPATFSFVRKRQG